MARILVTEEIAESLGLDQARGALVASVTEGSPAEDAGLEQGDVILSFDGKSVDEMRKLPRIVAETPIDEEVEVVIWRKGGEATLDVTVGLLDETEEQVASAPTGNDAMPGEELETLGLTLSTINDAARQQFGLGDSVEGVVVTDVDAESPAGEKGLREGDVILEVSQEKVASPDDVSAQVKDARDAGRKSVLLLLQRGDELRFVAVRIDQG